MRKCSEAVFRRVRGREENFRNILWRVLAAYCMFVKAACERTLNIHRPSPTRMVLIFTTQSVTSHGRRLDSGSPTVKYKNTNVRTEMCDRWRNTCEKVSS